MMHSIEAEQALLGGAILNPEVFERVSGIVKPDDFFDTTHADIWDRIGTRRLQDQAVNLVTLKLDFDGHEGMADLGGPAYLVRLAGAAMSIFACRDYAGTIAELSRKRRLAAALQQALSDLDGEKDAAAVLGAVEAYGLTEEGRGKADIISFTKALTEAVRGATAAHGGDGPQAMPSGIPRLDEMIGGFYPGDLVILGGRPGMGKSSLALTFALNAARRGFGVAVASLEMTPDSLALRAISEATDRAGRGVAYTAARKGQMTDEEFDRFRWSAEEIHQLPIKIIPPAVREIGELYAAVRRCAKQFEAKKVPFGAVIVDYLQLLKASQVRNRFEVITEISIALKQMALGLGVPVIALSQLSRSVESREDKRPVMSDLRESGQLEQDADLILFTYRAEYYLARERPDDDDLDALQAWREALSKAGGWLDIIIAKQRMGETGGVRVRFDERFNSIRGQA